MREECTPRRSALLMTWHRAPERAHRNIIYRDFCIVRPQLKWRFLHADTIHTAN